MARKPKPAPTTKGQRVDDFQFSEAARESLQAEGVPRRAIPEIEEAATLYVALRASEQASATPAEVAEAHRIGISAAVTKFFQPKDQRGRPRAKSQRQLAEDVAAILEAYGLPISDSKLGPFVAVLQVVFDEAGGPARDRRNKPIGGYNAANGHLFP